MCSYCSILFTCPFWGLGLMRRLNALFGTSPELKALTARAGEILALQKIWEAVTPPPLNQHSHVGPLHGGELTVYTPSGAVAASSKCCWADSCKSCKRKAWKLLQFVSKCKSRRHPARAESGAPLESKYQKLPARFCRRIARFPPAPCRGATLQALMDALPWYLAGGALAGVLAGMLGRGRRAGHRAILTFIFTARHFPSQHVLHLALGTSLSDYPLHLRLVGARPSPARRGHWQTVRRIAPGIAIGCLAGAWLAARLQTGPLKILFVAFEFYVGTQMLLEFAPTRCVPYPVGSAWLVSALSSAGYPACRHRRRNALGAVHGVLQP